MNFLSNVKLNTKESFIIILPITGIATYYLYYKVFVCKRPKVHINSSNGKLKEVLDNVKSLKKRYQPPLLFFGGQLQTILGSSQRLINKIAYRREILVLNDGGIVALDFLGDEVSKNKPILLFLPGLASSSQTPYVKTLVTALAKSCDVIVFNNRGVGGVPFKTTRSYCAANTEDLKEVISHITSKYEGRTFVAVGTSMGGMLLAKYLTTENDIPFKYAMLISILWDCVMGVRSCEKLFVNRYLINGTITKQLIKIAIKMEKNQEKSKMNMKEIRNCKTIRDFDTTFTAPEFGFKDPDHYYESSTTNDITKFPIPVIGISATDDPMQPGELLPINQIKEKASNLALITTTHGGHLGFLEGMNKNSVHYLEKICDEIMTEVCKSLC